MSTAVGEGSGASPAVVGVLGRECPEGAPMASGEGRLRSLSRPPLRKARNNLVEGEAHPALTRSRRCSETGAIAPGRSPHHPHPPSGPGPDRRTAADGLSEPERPVSLPGSQETPWPAPGPGLSTEGLAPARRASGLPPAHPARCGTPARHCVTACPPAPARRACAAALPARPQGRAGVATARAPPAPKQCRAKPRPAAAGS